MSLTPDPRNQPTPPDVPPPDTDIETFAAHEPPCILDLQGLGKEFWADVDAAEHVDNERRSWD